MLCEKCKKNEAKINLVKIVNGEKHEIWLCEECARDISDIAFLNSMGEEKEFPFQRILTGLLVNIGGATVKQKEIICKNCGLTYAEFKKSGTLGCSKCYDSFLSVLEPIIKRTQLGMKHVGKIPKFNGKELIQKRNLKDLKEQLQKYILTEEYEKAAVVRDKIKELELFIRQSNMDKKDLNLQGENYNEKLDSSN